MNDQLDDAASEDRQADPEFLDTLLTAASLAINVGQLYLMWRDASDEAASPRINHAAIDLVTHLEENLRKAGRLFNEIVEIFQRAEVRNDEHFFDRPVRAGNAIARFEPEELQRVLNLTTQLASELNLVHTAVAGIANVRRLTSLPNGSILRDNIGDVADEVNSILWSGKDFRTANREMAALLERLWRGVEGYRRSVNQ